MVLLLLGDAPSYVQHHSWGRHGPGVAIFHAILRVSCTAISLTSPVRYFCALTLFALWLSCVDVTSHELKFKLASGKAVPAVQVRGVRKGPTYSFRFLLVP